MATQRIEVEVPEDLLELLKRSRIGERPLAEQVRFALAVQLFQEGVISVGKAAEIAGEARAPFELLLGSMGIPPVRYSLQDYEQDSKNLEKALKKAATK
jgi:predicted HTH domain antitoxin